VKEHWVLWEKRSGHKAIYRSMSGASGIELLHEAVMEIMTVTGYPPVSVEMEVEDLHSFYVYLAEKCRVPLDDEMRRGLRLRYCTPWGDVAVGGVPSL
jgi:hypothetical protein